MRRARSWRGPSRKAWLGKEVSTFDSKLEATCAHCVLGKLDDISVVAALCRRRKG
jgi:hypothetical protein